MNGVIYFLAYNFASGVEIQRKDGISEGTQIVLDIPVDFPNPPGLLERAPVFRRFRDPARRGDLVLHHRILQDLPACDHTLGGGSE